MTPSEKYADLSIYTLRIPGVRIYVVNSTHLIPVVQRQWRTLLFSPISIRASEVTMGGSKEAVKILSDDMVTEYGFVPSTTRVIHAALSHGTGSDDLNRKAFEGLAATLDRLVVDHPSDRRVYLYEWLRHELLLATTDSVYGPHNPLRDPANEADWL